MPSTKIKNSRRDNTENKAYIADSEEKETLNYVYEKVDSMIEERNTNKKQFNDRTLREFIDDSQKRAQGYVPDRKSQGKTDDQANVFSQDTRTKLKAIIAGIASVPPQQKFKAVSRFNKTSQDPKRAETMKNLVKHSRQKVGHNPELEIFWEAWNCAVSGTVVKYDGYVRTKMDRKIINSYNPETGDIKFDEIEVTVEDQIVDLNIPLREFFVYDMKIKNVQDQPHVAWITYKDMDTAEFELSKYKNFQYIKEQRTNESGQQYESETRTFMHQWKSRVGDTDDVEIIKFYSIVKDQYVIIANGVVLLDAPLLWGRAKKSYPFSKTIHEPFADDEFFYGNSLPNANMDVQDVINALFNMMLDKTAYSIDKPLVAGLANKDLLEQEQENMGLDRTIYVEDVNQVKELNIQGVTSSEFAMLKMAQSKMDSQTVSKQQQGFAGQGSTAREIIIANEHAQELKGLFFKFLSDLWLQKTQIRTINILQNYTIPKVQEIVGEDGSITYKEMFRPILIDDADFPNGERGTLEIQIFENKEKLPNKDELDIQEERMKMQGENYQVMAMTSNYLDNYDYDVQIITQSIHNRSKLERQAKVEDKVQRMMAMFPQEFMLNKDIIFKDWVEAYDDDPSRYKIMPANLNAPGGGQQQQQQQQQKGRPKQQK